MEIAKSDFSKNYESFGLLRVNLNFVIIGDLFTHFQLFINKKLHLENLHEFLRHLPEITKILENDSVRN